jgi:hypothetical protein
MTEMRECSTLDWRQVVDGSRLVDRANVWKNPTQIINAAVRTYRRDYWQDQPTLIEVWSEKSTIQGVIGPVLDEFGVTFRVMKGFGSFTALKQAAEDSLEMPQGHKGVILYLGDFDPSGLWMSERDIPERLARYGSQWDFERIGVLVEDTVGLPHFDSETKADDARHRWYLENYGRRCWEIDAIDPNDLRARVREQIETRLDLPAWAHAKSIEAAEIDSMRDFYAAFERSLGVNQ